LGGKDQAVPDLIPVDLSPPDGPQLDKPITSPDAAVCTAAKTVWGGFKWDEGCVWQ